MSAKRDSGGIRAGGKRAGEMAGERRHNQTLRELLDELIVMVRVVSRTSSQMSPDELAYAQQRMEWLADEVWRSATQDGTVEPPA